MKGQIEKRGAGVYRVRWYTGRKDGKRTYGSKIAAVCAAVGAVLTMGSSAIASDLSDATTWLRAYYRDYPVGGGWRVTKIAREEGDLAVYLSLPDSQADAIINHAIERQRRILSIACPSKLEGVWTLLPADSDIVLRPMKGGEVFSDLSCRRHGG